MEHDYGRSQREKPDSLNGFLFPNLTLCPDCDFTQSVLVVQDKDTLEFVERVGNDSESEEETPVRTTPITRFDIDLNIRKLYNKSRLIGVILRNNHIFFTLN